MRPTLLIAAVLLLAGCNRHKPAPPVLAGVAQAAPGGVAEQPVAFAVPTGPEYHEGRSATQWAQALQQGDAYQRQKAGQALGALGERGFRHLLEGMSSRSWEMRLTCLKSLTREAMTGHSRQTLPAVTRLLQDDNGVVRQEALLRTGWFGDQGKQALPVLRGMAARDDDTETRRMAVDIIIGMHPTVAALTGLLRDDNPQVRKQAAVRLQFLGPASSPAIPTLRSVLEQDPDSEVRTAVRNALTVVAR